MTFMMPAKGVQFTTAREELGESLIDVPERGDSSPLTPNPKVNIPGFGIKFAEIHQFIHGPTDR